jgi:hypothetical protein
LKKGDELIIIPSKKEKVEVAEKLGKKEEQPTKGKGMPVLN